MNFDISEGNQLSYFQNGYFFKKKLMIAWATKSGKQVKEWNYFPNKKCVSFSRFQSLLSKFSNQNSFSHIRRSSSIRKVQVTVYYIEIRYKCPVNNTKQDSERTTQNFFWRAQTILDMGQNSGKSQFCLFLSKLCLKTHLESDLFGVQYVFCLFNLGFTKWMFVQQSPIPLKLSKS